MGGDDNESCQMGFQHCAEMMLNCPSSGMNTRPLSEKFEPMSMSSGYGSGWDPIVSLSQSGSFGRVSSIVSQGDLPKSTSYPMLLETQGISTSTHYLNYPLDPNLAQMMPKLPVFGGGNFTEIANPFGLPGDIQNPNVLFPPNYASNRSGTDERSCANADQAERERQIPEGRAAGVSPDGKRKRDSNSPCPPNKNCEGDCQNDHSSENSGAKESEDKRPKTEQNTTGNSSGKQVDKQVKDNSQGEEAPKNYIHVRARRGQATNSHSLAERVRREKISERMRLLQELVPGCNKITGKAVMLDEIINYVQSLQQQVEFLSMKLATVNPELNFDIDRLLSKDILHSRASGTPVIGFDQGMSSSHGFTPGFHQGTLATLPNPASQYHRMSQPVWDNDLQNLLHMGFDSNSSLGNLGPNGNSKPEL